MARLKAVFFDLGGTLIDLESDKSSHLKVLEATKQRYGLDVTAADLHRGFVSYIGRFEAQQAKHWRPILELTEEAFEEEMARMGIAVDTRDVQWFMKTYMTTYGRGIILARGAMDTLRGAKLLGIHVGILSDVDDDWAKLVLDNLRLRPLLDSVTTSQTVGVAKPNPRIFLAALKKAKCEPIEALHVGDSLERDVRGAKAIGMRAAHIGPQPSSESDYQARTMVEFLPVLKKVVESGQ